MPRRLEPAEFCPPRPEPPERLPGLLDLLGRLRRNPLECWSAEFFREPIVEIKLPLLTAYVVNDPTAIRRVLMDNTQNYRKDRIQRRILSSGLGDGLLSVEGERWEMQRRALAALFAKRTVTSCAAAMLQAADRLMARLTKLGNGAVLDVAAAMTLVTLDVLALTIFSDGIGGDPEDFRSKGVDTPLLGFMRHVGFDAAKRTIHVGLGRLPQGPSRCTARRGPA